MANIQYIGARYVPKFYENPDDASNNWKAGVAYEPLTVVTYQDNSYTSKKPVPATVSDPASEPSYWVLTANYSAAIEGLQEEISDIKNGDLNDNSIAYSKLTDDVKRIIETNNTIIFMPNTEVNDPTQSNGECIVFITRKTRKIIMFDTGSPNDYAAIKVELESNNIEHIDYFILSHYHGDHWANATDLIADGFIDESTIVYLPRDTNAVSGWDVVQANVRALFASNTVITNDSSSPLIVDDLKFEFFNCDASDFAYYESQGYNTGNTYSTCAYVTCGNFSILLTGDIITNAIRRNLSLDKFKHCNILNMPHHGIGGGANAYDLYLMTSPDIGIMCCGAASEYTYNNFWSDDTKYTRDAQIAFMNSLDIPVYNSGYGAVYVGISDNEYTVITNGKKVNSYYTQTQSINLYVDDTYQGIVYGTPEHPFNTIPEALAFINNQGAAKVYIINVVGEYNHPAEEIEITNKRAYIQLKGTMDGSDFNVKIKNIDIVESFVSLINIALKGADEIATIRARIGSKVLITDCLIDGDTTAFTDNYKGAALQPSEHSFIQISGTEISNRNVVIFAESKSDVLMTDCTGSGNDYLICGIDGGDIVINTNTIGYTTLVSQRETATPPCNLFRLQYIAGYSAYSPFLVSLTIHASAQTETLDLSPRIYNDHIMKVYCSDGTVYQVNKIGNGNLSTPVKVQNDFGSPDASLSVTVSGKDLIITHSSWVKVVAV